MTLDPRMSTLFVALALAASLTPSCAQVTPSAGRQTPSMVAFSLSRAHTLAQSNGSMDSEVAALGHIGRLVGVVFDATTNDVILVGFRDTAAPMQLDDLAVAMRAAARKEWPLVSIDPTPETGLTGMQRVRMEGGVEDTPFGHDLLALDVWLKRSALGTVDTSLVSYFDLRARILNQHEEPGGASRMWFRVLHGRVEERDGIFALDAMRIGVLTERVAEGAGILEPDLAAEQFAEALTKSYDQLAGRFSELRRLRPLYQAVAVAEAIRALPDSQVAMWLQAHPVRRAETAREFKLETRASPISTANGTRSLRLSGGVQLKSFVLRVRDRDVTALREAVLLSKPGEQALTWRVPLTNWDGDSGTTADVDTELAHKLGSRLQWELGDVTPNTREQLYEPRALPPDGTIITSTGPAAAATGSAHVVGQAKPTSAPDAPATIHKEGASSDRGGISADIEIRPEDMGERARRRPPQ